MTPRSITLSLALLSLIPWSSVSAQFDHQHKAWNELLKKHIVVINGGKASQVRYAAFAKDRDALKSYLDTLSNVSQKEYNDWNKEQQLAFLINSRKQFFAKYANLLTDSLDYQRAIRDRKVQFHFMEYDWKLNASGN